MKINLYKIASLALMALLVCAITVAIQSPREALAQENDFFVQGKLMAGNVFLKAGNIPDAIRHFEEIEKSDPSNPDALIGLIRCYAKIGDFAKAQQKLTTFEQKYQYDTRTILLKAEFLALKGHYEEAADYYIHVISLGIYRFEALQGLIQLYCKHGNESWKKVIDTTIPLYENANQIILYKHMIDNLKHCGKKNESDAYQKKLEAILKMEQNPNLRVYNSSIDPLQWTVSESQRLLDAGLNDRALDILADASMRYPGEPRVQELLKRCYMQIMSDVPIHSETSYTDSSFSNVVSQVGVKTSSLTAYIPLDVEMSDEVRAYTYHIIAITSKTAKYFEDMTKNIVALQEKLSTELAAKGGGDKDKIERNFAELSYLMVESAKVSKQEFILIQEIKPPEGFENFHKLVVEISQVRIEAFDLIANFIESRSMEDMESAFEKITRGQALTERMATEFRAALSTSNILEQKAIEEKSE